MSLKFISFDKTLIMHIDRKKEFKRKLEKFNEIKSTNTNNKYENKNSTRFLFDDKF